MRKESFQGHYILNKSFQSKADLRYPQTISNFKFHIQCCEWGLDCDRLDECLIWLYTWCLMRNIDNKLWWCNTKKQKWRNICDISTTVFIIFDCKCRFDNNIAYFKIFPNIVVAIDQLIKFYCNPSKCKLQVCGIRDSWFVNIHRKRGNATFQQSSATTCGVFAVFPLPHKLYGLSYSPNIFDNIGFHKTIIP